MSSLILEEFLEAQDPRLLGELFKTRGPALAHFAVKLIKDSRPFARGVLFEYLAQGSDRIGHRIFVKTIFKTAEKSGDLEVLAHCLVSFDRLVPVEVTSEWRYDPAARRHLQRKVLRQPPSMRTRYPANRRGRTYLNPVTQKKTVQIRAWEHYSGPDAFSFGTRRYLQRRAWRVFRGVAKKDPAAFRRWMGAALASYRDEHLASVGQLLSSWSFMHLLYWGSPVLARKPLGIEVAEGQSLEKLEYAPYAPAIWTEAFDELLSLVKTARSRPVRRFAVTMLLRDHQARLARIPVRAVVGFLQSEHPELQEFGGSLLERAEGLESLPISEWLALLRIHNPMVVEQLCAQVKKHVAPSRLSLEQCVELGQSEAAPVGELGLEWAKEKLRTAEDLAVLLKLRNAPLERIRVAAMEFAVQRLVLEDSAKPLLVRELLDAKYVDVRTRAMALMDTDRRFGEALELWLAMSETPYPDVRTRFLSSLSQREASFELPTLKRVWATAILDVHRGSRTRRRVAKQVANRAVHDAAHSAELLPLLGHVLRSVRPAEQAAALAQLTRAATRDPKLREQISKELSELKFVGEEVSQ